MLKQPLIGLHPFRLVRVGVSTLLYHRSVGCQTPFKAGGVGDSKHCVDVVDKDGDSKEKPGEMVRTRSWFQVKQLKLSK